MDNTARVRPSILISKQSGSTPLLKRRSKPECLDSIFKILHTNLSDWRQSFLLLDKLNSGHVSKVELKMVLRRHSCSLDHAEDLFNYYLSQGSFDYRSFLSAAQESAPLPSLAELEGMRTAMKRPLSIRKISPTQLFLKFDKNNNGLVSIDEIQHYYKNLGVPLKEEVLNYLMAQFTNNPGGLNYQEFSDLFWGELRIKENIEPFLREMSILLLTKQYDFLEYLRNVDPNRMGKFSKQQFAEHISGVLASMSRTDAEALFDILNMGKQADIRYSEIGALIKSVRVSALSIEAKEVFNLFLDEFFADNREVQTVLMRRDGDRDGRLTYAEWAEALNGMGIALDQAKLMPIFNALSKNATTVLIEGFLGEIQRRVWAMQINYRPQRLSR